MKIRESVSPRRVQSSVDFRLTIETLLTPQYYGTQEVRLPAVDCRNVEHGILYDPLLKAGMQRIGTGSSNVGVKLARCVECLSVLERAVWLAFVFNPIIVDIREQYPMADPEIVRRRVQANESLRRADVPSLDFVVTLIHPNTHRLMYAGISVKLSKVVSTKKVKARNKREMTFCAGLDWPWFIITELNLDAVQCKNRRVLREYIRRSRVADFEDILVPFAHEFLGTGQSTPLDRRIERVARRLGRSLDDGYRAFSFAVMMGLIRLDWTQLINQFQPLKIL
ncbi:hypothetical protein AWB79_02200 [Caballeronia hypogeia]|uniref:Uncharacterized protein n=1 Tax=Caballeronia hypogeia TaxID=1777140 RepID=A0A158ACJ2_9BURK|nr:TnsA endonuclease N-terminal domain-containing protein [Caballeronia hypogeia]SAK55561.1 hypothetical protein AWB79_02200 [Caballeronia hypogeia]